MFVLLIGLSGCEGNESYTEIKVTLTNTSKEEFHMWANYERADPSNKLKPGVKREKVFTYKTKTDENAGYIISAFAGKIDDKVFSKQFVLKTDQPTDQISINFDGVNLVQAD